MTTYQLLLLLGLGALILFVLFNEAARKVLALLVLAALAFALGWYWPKPCSNPGVVDTGSTTPPVSRISIHTPGLGRAE